MSNKERKGKKQVSCYLPDINGEVNPLWLDILTISKAKKWKHSFTFVEAAAIGVKVLLKESGK